jgi:transposase
LIPAAENHQIIDIVPTRTYTDVAGWINAQPQAWKERIRFGTLDMSATYAAVYSVSLPNAAQVVDPFHLIALANRCLDAVRRRVARRRGSNKATIAVAHSILDVA